MKIRKFNESKNDHLDYITLYKDHSGYKYDKRGIPILTDADKIEIPIISKNEVEDYFSLLEEYSDRKIHIATCLYQLDNDIFFDGIVELDPDDKYFINEKSEGICHRVWFGINLKKDNSGLSCDTDSLLQIIKEISSIRKKLNGYGYELYFSLGKDNIQFIIKSK